MIDHLSASSVKLFYQCGYRFYLNKIANLPDTGQFAFTVYGSAMHKAIEAMSKGSAEVEKIFADELTSLWPTITIKPNMTIEEMIEMGNEALDIFKEYALPYLKPLDTEMPFTIKRPNKLPITGFIDYVDHKKIVDYKLGKSYFNSSNTYEFELPMAIYGYAYKEMFGYYPELYIIRAKYGQKNKKTVFKQWVIDRLNLDFELMINYWKYFDCVEYAIKTGFFSPTLDKSFCPYCPYSTSDCHQKAPFVEKEIDISTLRLTSLYKVLR